MKMPDVPSGIFRVLKNLIGRRRELAKKRALRYNDRERKFIEVKK